MFVLLLCGVIITGLESILFARRIRALISPAGLQSVESANSAGKVKVWLEGWMVGFLIYEPYATIAQGLALVVAGGAIVLAISSMMLHAQHAQT